MTEIIGAYGGYRNTSSFAFTCLIYHATTLFCSRNFDYRNDQLGKTVGQMVGAARSARQNIVEGSSRAGTSKETELRLYDVAKGSLEELAGDYEAFLMNIGEVPWDVCDPHAVEFAGITLSRFNGINGPNIRHDYGAYFLELRKRFSSFLESPDPVVAANSILLAIDQTCRILHKQIVSVSEEFRKSGGFSERMSKARLEMRDDQGVSDGAPKCPECGRPMRKIFARKGSNAGKQFWGCSGWPECHGTISIDTGGSNQNQ